MEDKKKLMRLIFVVAKQLLEDNKLSIVDDHCRSINGELITAPALVLYKGELCPLWHETAISINPLYLGVDGQVHLSRSSIGIINSTWDIPSAVDLWNKSGNTPMQILYQKD
jgi:hypothetical protein